MIIDRLSNFSKTGNPAGSGFKVQGFNSEPQNNRISNRIHNSIFSFYGTPAP